jgi:PHD/YefM family antitoxin component YafN of YafNO toxin-antitoxin module
MIDTSLSNFLNNTEAIISNSISNDEPVTIKSEYCNLVLITEDEYKRLTLNDNILKYNSST